MSFDDTLGAAFIGFAVSTMLYGILSMQMYTYFQRYGQDRPFYKGMVVLIWLLETLHSGLTGHVYYHYGITNFQNVFALLVPTWTIVIQVLVGALISVLVKSAFAMRVWRFSGNSYILTGFIAILNVAILVLGVIFTVQGFKVQTFLELPELNWVTTAILATSVFTDIVIAASLTYYLHHLRNAFSANTLVNGLIRYSIETGAVTSICGVATLIAFRMVPLSFIYLSFFFVLSKLYSNSLLATLNTRRVVRGRGTDREPGTTGDFTIIQGMSNGQIQTTHSIFGPVDWSKRPGDIEVNVRKETLSAEPYTLEEGDFITKGNNGYAFEGIPKLQFSKPRVHNTNQGQSYEMSTSPTESDKTQSVPPDYALTTITSSNAYTRGNEVYAYGGQGAPLQRPDRVAPGPGKF